MTTSLSFVSRTTWCDYAIKYSASGISGDPSLPPRLGAMCGALLAKRAKGGCEHKLKMPGSFEKYREQTSTMDQRHDPRSGKKLSVPDSKIVYMNRATSSCCSSFARVLYCINDEPLGARPSGVIAVGLDVLKTPQGNRGITQSKRMGQSGGTSHGCHGRYLAYASTMQHLPCSAVQAAA